MNNNGPLFFYGMRVYRTSTLPIPPKAKVQLSAGLMVSDEFRAQMDHWLGEFFGYTEAIHALQAPHLNALYVSTLVYNKLKAGANQFGELA